MNKRSPLKHCAHSRQAGNALWFILLGVALLGFLTAVISRNSGSSNQGNDPENAVIHLSQAMKYTQGLELAIQNLRLNNGCSENEISFENSEVSEYENTNSPDDYSCHVFHRAGGAQNWQRYAHDNKEWIITNTARIDENPESEDTDLIIFLRDVSEVFCSQANRRLNEWIQTPSWNGSGLWDYYDGTYPSSILILTLEIDGEEQRNITSGCFYNDAEEEYDFFYTLLLR